MINLFSALAAIALSYLCFLSMSIFTSRFRCSSSSLLPRTVLNSPLFWLLLLFFFL
ncbi:hypothetical protein BDY19DRAFT_961949 [Irpex rosettiformis]|uniref:Uncharacterized protein n=1 Tax=Irpex rosettiformis TaxID=378272 RepID=A0ACB8TW47_9APHY|nr:hypothetical protein BDY19DRAFT_961949 [Irpex rosettiformis]